MVGGAQLRIIDVSAKDSDLGYGLVRSVAMRHFLVRLTGGTSLSTANLFVAVWAFLPGWQCAAQLANAPVVNVILWLGCRAFLRARPLMANMAGYFGARAARGSPN